MTMHVCPEALLGPIRNAPPAVSGDAVDIANKLTEAFEAFKTANDERLKMLEKGLSDVVTEEKVDRINADVSKFADQLTIANKKIAQLQLGGGGADGDADLKKHVLAFQATLNHGKPVGEVTDAQVEEYIAYRQAWARWLRRGGRDGENLPAEIRNALSVGSEPDGGYWAPAELSSTVQTRMFETSDVRSIANVMSISADAFEYPTDLNQATSGGWVGETASRSETATPQIGKGRIVAHEQYAEPHATQQLLDDAVVDVEGWLAAKIADILVRTENTAFVTGDGIAKPRGFMDYKSTAVTTDDGSRDWQLLQYVITGASGDFAALSGVAGASDIDCLITIISKLKPMYRPNARWCMSRATEAAVRKLKDGQGRYLVGMGDIRDGATGFNLFGYPITTLEDMSAIAADSFSISFGDMRAAYTIVDRMGIRILRDPFTSKPFVKFYTTKRVGGDVMDFDALKLLKFGTS